MARPQPEDGWKDTANVVSCTNTTAFDPKNGALALETKIVYEYRAACPSMRAW
eukprot:SAG22_NODE_4516_length_1246_cov_1.549259_1_plen_53_part_00